MPFSSLFTLYLLLSAVLIVAGNYCNPPDVVAWAILITFTVVNSYIFSHLGLPGWYLTLISRTRKAILGF